MDAVEGGSVSLAHRGAPVEDLRVLLENLGPLGAIPEGRASNAGEEQSRNSEPAT